MTRMIGNVNPMIQVNLDDIQLWQANYRQGDVQLIVNSIRRFGYNRSVSLWRDNIVIAGNHTIKALRELKAQGDDVPQNVTMQDGAWWIDVHDVSHLDDKEAEAYAIADNRTADVAVNDAEQLATLLTQIQAYDDDLFQATGWDEDALRVLLNELEPPDPPDDPGAQIDRAEELNEKWQVQRGDLWIIPSAHGGEHRLLCGDSTDRKQIERISGNLIVNFVFADPPYGINIVATNGGGEAYNIPFGGVKKKGLGTVGGSKPFGSKKTRGSVGASNVVEVGKYAPIAGDDSVDVAIQSSQLYLDLFPDAVHVWWGGNYYADNLPASPCWLVWDKDNTGNFADCELAWTNQPTAVRMFTHRWNGMLRDSEQGRRWHPTQKPSALAYWTYGKYSHEGDVIIDPFAGAGCSMVGAEQIGNRSNLSIELSREYCAVILERMSDMGLEPVKQVEQSETYKNA